jgi:hypothetical protein
MTEPYARPADDNGDATIPLVPDAGYAPTEQFPFAEETLVNPTGTSPWSAGAQLDASTTGYGTPANDDGAASQAASQGYVQPVAPQPHYAQPQPFPPYGQPQPVTTNYSSTNYVQPQAAPAPGSYAPRPDQAGYAEPYGPADRIGAQNIYQGFPTSGYSQQPPSLPAVMQDPVGYDYGYGRPAAATDHPNAVISLVLGILGLVVFPLLGPVAWYLAAKGRREMAAFPGRWRPSGSLTAGLVLGIIGTAVVGLIALGVLMMVVMLVSFAG